MHTRILKQMREAVRLRQYVVTLHATEEMDDDGFSIFDVERCILSGEITERQKEHSVRKNTALLNGNIWFRG